MNKHNIILIVVILFSNIAQASQYDKCFQQAGARYHISPQLLQAIGRVESNYNPRAENQKTKARGLMQIHPWWFTKIQSLGTDPEQLWDGCTNIMWGTWILAQEIQRYGYSWTAVGAYGAGGYNQENIDIREAQYKTYARKVQRKLQAITQSKNNTARRQSAESDIKKPKRYTQKDQSGGAANQQKISNKNQQTRSTVAQGDPS